MICYLVRHGKDDESLRGGWSQQPLTEEGILQSETLAEQIASKTNIRKIYSSDLKRAMQTAQIIAQRMQLPVTALSSFRETNNGDLAGMKNSIALERYPGLFWNQLDWEQCYPNGESPRQFYERVRTAWEVFSQMIASQQDDVLLVTHGGVIHVILSILEGRMYSNAEKQRPVKYTQMITLVQEEGHWKEVI